MRTIDSGLATEMASGHFSPVTKVYAQPHLPNWSIQTSTAQTLPDNLFGHDCVHDSGYFYRARSGSTSDPGDNNLYFAKIADTADPTTWESSWVNMGTDVVAPPRWASGVTPGGTVRPNR